MSIYPPNIESTVLGIKIIVIQENITHCFNAHVPETNAFHREYVSTLSTSRGKIWAARAAVAVHSLALGHWALRPMEKGHFGNQYLVGGFHLKHSERKIPRSVGN